MLREVRDVANLFWKQCILSVLEYLQAGFKIVFFKKKKKKAFYMDPFPSRCWGARLFSFHS